MKLHKAQIKIAKDDHRFRVINCGRRFGKTTLAVEEMKGYVLFAEREMRLAYIAPTVQQARDIAWEMVKKELEPIITNKNETRMEVAVVNQQGIKSIIQLRGWENVETLRGQTFDFLVIDEVASMRNFWLNWQEVLRPALTDRKGHVMFISTPKGFNHFYDLYNLGGTDSNFKSFNFTSYDNPHLPAEELNEAKSQMTADRFAQEYLADFRKQEGLVYKQFNRKKHLYYAHEKLPNFVEKMIGVDFGYTNPACVLVIHRDADSNYWITDEWYKAKQLPTQIAEMAASFEPNKCYADPEAPDKIEELKNHGLYCLDVNKGKGSVEAGINRIQDLFQEGRIKVSAACRNLIMELETYAYREKKDGVNEPEHPQKENDHAMDAMRYVLSMDNGRVQSSYQDFNLYTQVYD